MKIKILDAIECEVSKRDGELLIPLLSFDAVYWQQGPHTKQRKVYRKQVFSHKGKNSWYFYTGLLPRVKAWCQSNNIPVEIEGEELKLKPSAKPFLQGITFREDQLKMINKACEIGRGSLIAPTQSGKTIVFLGIISCFPKLNILILSHTSTIVHQTYERLLKYGIKDTEVFGGGVTIQNPSKRITVSTIQSFSKLDPKFYTDYYDCVIVDELHRVSKQVSQYEQVLSQLLAPLRFGFTATPKDDPEAEFTYEGLIGPIISRLSIQEATELEILKKPTLKLIKAKYSPTLQNIYKYQDTYEKVHEHGKLVNGERVDIGAYSAGIVENAHRNSQIVNIVGENIKNKKITIIFVTYTLHGQLLQNEINKKFSIDIPFVEGDTPMLERKRIKDNLSTKKIPVCIASNSWIEGITIKTITDLILAGGGKSELQLIQKVGRVLANNQVTITDFLDLGNKHMIFHTGERLAVYSEKCWI